MSSFDMAILTILAVVHQSEFTCLILRAYSKVPVALIPRVMPVLASSPAQNAIPWKVAPPFWFLNEGTGGGSELAHFNDVSLLPTAKAFHGLLF